MKTARFNFLCKTFAALMLTSAPAVTQASLVYETINGNSFIYDSVDNTTWTQNGNISAQTFDWQNASNWAANLSFEGIYDAWQLPTSTQFTSLFDQLYPAGGDHKYGSQVFFGAGANDYAANVQGQYWTYADNVTFNFYYGYAGYSTSDVLYSAWAVTVIPEPATLSLLVFGLASCFVQSKRGRSQL